MKKYSFLTGLIVLSSSIFQIEAAATSTTGVQNMQAGDDITCGCEGLDTVCKDSKGKEVCHETNGYFCKPKESGQSYQRSGDGSVSMDESLMSRGGDFNPFEGPYQCDKTDAGNAYCRNKYKRTVCFQK